MNVGQILTNEKQEGFDALVRGFMKALIQEALDECYGNKSAAAKMLKIHRTTLVERMKRLGFTLKEPNQKKETQNGSANGNETN